MPSFFRTALALMLALLSAGATAQPAKADSARALTVESFFTPSPIQGMKLSPSGRRVALRDLGPEGRTQLKVIDLEGKEQPLIIAAFSRLDVGSVSWVNEDWLIFRTFDEVTKDSQRYGPGLISVKRDGTRARELIMKKYGKGFRNSGAKTGLEPNHGMIGFGAPGSSEIVLEEYIYDATYSDVIATNPLVMDVSTGAVRSLLKGLPRPPGKVKGWLIDNLGQARLGYGQEGPNTIIYWADPKTLEWRKIAEFETLRAPFSPEYIDEKDQLFVSVVSSKTGLSEIRKFDFATGKPMEEAIVALPGFDAENVSAIQDRGSNTVHGLRLLTDASSVAWMSPLMRKIQDRIDGMLPTRLNVVSCAPCATPTNVLVASYSDTTPGDYFIYNVPTDKLERVAEVRPSHRADLMANKELYRTKARDGADLPVWVTRSESATARPAVVLVHGGPWVRGGAWEYDAQAQFLASRGYVVIEPEFRGSTGFGDKHYRAGWKQWGQSMQDDVADALKFAVDKGWADPKKVCIAGASYGGYATLMGLARHPDLYKCGVAWVAVTDPRLMFSVHWSDISDNSKKYSMPQLIGDPEKDADMLKANAPIELVAKINAPVLLAYGAKDVRVPIVHGEKMRDAMTQQGNKPEWVVYDDEAHGFSRTPNLVDFWSRVERFLDQHLK